MLKAIIIIVRACYVAIQNGGWGVNGFAYQVRSKPYLKTRLWLLDGPYIVEVVTTVYFVCVCCVIMQCSRGGRGCGDNDF